MGSTAGDKVVNDLGNHIYLEKQDRLRDIGVDIQTSQIVVVGSQSSGKSSLLENLTGFSFPRGQGLCTRYATQITLRRNPVESIVMSITPSTDATQETRDRIRVFHRQPDSFQATSLAAVIQEANKVMGIRPGDRENDLSLPMFSNDILKVEISGPDKPHLTVIDVPGLFQVTDEGRTTESEKAMVENMVRRYMENERTIVLAVMSCLADRATEGVMQLAKSADPKGERTVGVLTKADLVNEKAVYKNIFDLVKGATLKLGYFVVRSRGADEDDIGVSECRELEQDLFQDPSWEPIAKLGRTGVPALNKELQVLLTDLAKRELPKQLQEVSTRLEACQKTLSAMGPAHSDAASQRLYLLEIALKFERISRDAREGIYGRDEDLFGGNDTMLIAEIISMNEKYSEYMDIKGCSYCFNDQTPTSEVLPFEKLRPKTHSILSNRGGVKVDDTVTPPYQSLSDCIKSCYLQTRGPELGTFGVSLLSRTFRTQSEKWLKIAIRHVHAVATAIHTFLTTLIKKISSEALLDQLWRTALTYNHYFNDNLQKARINRLEKKMRTHAINAAAATYNVDVVTLNMNSLRNLVDNKSNADQVQEDVHDILQSYYKVARKRFVDNICHQAIDYYLLDAPDSPLKIFSPNFVMGLSDTQLDQLAGESAVAKAERERLQFEIQDLEEAMEVLRS
ncbi:P-loop containing nucleoside triphosphate hydrolase protein [Rhypophila decipiens]|uniref:P-loop containing nucleoside triphosphate hydrolase protein n=1 Tax=Rhypophila decipiens TaxID=261697 RepID=A0AAN7BAC9_9PEZI|nr:P-loop containing nucleoside triphosphate hydrolase protein [Rhypophila decipiens]